MQSACTAFHSEKKKLRNNRRNSWKFGNCKRRKTTDKSQTHRKYIEPTVEATSKANANAKVLISSTQAQSETQSEENSHDKSCVSARTLSYDLHRIIITSSSSSSSSYNSPKISSDSSSSSSSNEEHDKTSTSKCHLNEGKIKKEYLKRLIRKKFKYISKTNSMQNQLNIWKFKRRIVSSDEESCGGLLPRRKCQRINSEDESSNDASSSSSCNIQVMYESHPNKSTKLHLSHEKMAEKELKINKQICAREARITLTKLEELDDINAIKWRKKNASRMIATKPLAEEQRVERNKSKGIIDSNEKASECSTKSLFVTEQIKNPIILKSSCLKSDKLISAEGALSTEKTGDKTLSHISDMKRLRKKYKLFKKPKVLMLKLENLQSSSSKSLPISKDGRYSADEIDCLTKKYINSVIKSSSLFKSDESLRRLVRRRGHMDSSFNRSDEKKSSIDTQVTNNSDTSNAFKIRIDCKSMSIISSSQNNPSSSNTSKKKIDESQKTMQEIWRDAFCAKKSSNDLEKKTIQQSTSDTVNTEETMSKSFKHKGLTITPVTGLRKNIPVQSITRNSSKKSTDAEHKSVFSPSSTPASSKKNDTLVASSGKRISARKQETSSKSAKCTETSKSELSVTDTNNSSGTAKDIVSDTLLQHKDLTIPVKNPQKNTAIKNISCDVCNILFENCRQLHIHKTNGGCKMFTSKASSSSSNVSEHVTDEVNKHRIESSKQSSKSSQHSSVENGEKLISNKVDQSLGSNKQTIRLSSSKTSETSSNNLPRKINKSGISLERKLDVDSQSKGKPQNKSLDNNVRFKCFICDKVFRSCMQLYRHTYKHSNSKFRDIYKIKTKLLENNKDDQSVKDTKESVEVITIDEQGNLNTEEPLTEPRVHEMAQNNLSSETNKTANSLEAENVILAREKQALSTANSAESDERKDLKRIKICNCHKANIKNNENNISVEIGILCDICMILFRRFECFETHRKHSETCVKNRRLGRKPILLCGNCHETANNIRNMLCHLRTHFLFNSKITTSFYCNICKVIFYGSGPNFYNHFTSHATNPFFLTSRVSFPKRSFIGSKLVQLPTADGNVTWETYIEIADYMCQKCKIPFVTQNELTSHEKSCQTDVASASASSDSRATKRSRIWLMCGFCSQTFLNRELFEQHSLDHKMKRNFHSHYTRVNVTAVASVFICKVCMMMSKSQEEFEKHWQTHGVLREDYVCSLCEKHFDSIDLFQEHTAVHDDEKFQKSIMCKVIYCDIDDQTNVDKHAVLDGKDIPFASLNSLTRKESIEDNASNKGVEKSSTVSASRDVTTQASKSGGNISQVASEQSRQKANNKITKDCSNNVTSKSNKSKLKNHPDDSDGEKLMIVTLEDDDSTGATEKNINDCSSKRKNDNERNPLKLQDVESCSNASKSSSSKPNEKSKESLTQLGVDASVSKDNKTLIGDKNTKYSTTMTTTMATVTMATGDNQASKSSLELQESQDPAASEADNSNKMPANAMSSVPKSFLRVKSLAELTNASEERCQCHFCDLQFDSTDKLNDHLLAIHILCPDQRNDQAFNDMRSILNPALPTMQTQNHPLYPTEYSNASLPNSASSNALKPGNILPSNSAPQSDNSHLQLPNQIIDQTKYLASSNLYNPMLTNFMQVSSENPNTLQFVIAPVSNSVSATQPQQLQQSQKLKQQFQQQQQQLRKPQQQLQQPQQQLQQPRQQLQQSQQRLRKFQLSAQPQQIQQQRKLQQGSQIYPQNMPQYIAQPINNTDPYVQQQQQRIGTATVKPFIQPTYQSTRPMYITKQHEQQQRETNVNDNIFGYLMPVPFATTSNNAISNPNNVMFVSSNQIQQTSNDATLHIMSDLLK